MEAFKLLTRSSTLQKAKNNPASDASARARPSSAQPLKAVERTVSSESRAHRGIKRKRNHTEQDYKQESVRQNAKSSGNPDVPLPQTNDSSFSQQERRSALRRNKVKVTVLQASDEAMRTEGAQIYPWPLTSFAQLRPRYAISRRLDENIQEQGYSAPTEVQLGSIPLLLEQRGDSASDSDDCNALEPGSGVDLMTVAPTGSGKTLAFLIPLLQRLIQHRNAPHAASSSGVQAIILAPSHELVEQIVNEGKKLAQGTGVRISALKNGTRISEDILEQKADDSINEEQEDPKRKVHTILKSDVVVSTPPMLLGAISTNTHPFVQNLPSVLQLVFDEADILLDKMFFDRTLAIWNACVNPALRVSFWSATINSTVETFMQRHILDRRKKVVPGGKSAPHYILRLIVGLKDSSIPSIDHRLTYAATEQGKLVALRQLMQPTSPDEAGSGSLRPPFLVFTQTIPRAIALHSELLFDIPPEAGGSSRIAVLHSELSETARSNIMAAVRKGDIWILITTDLLSRGIDFKGMNGVVSYDIPSTSASYVHRAGRTGRQGRAGGVAVTLYTKEDIPYVKNVANVIAASAKAKKSPSSDDAKSGESDMSKWLLDSLPDISKKTRQRLKQSGIEHRKTSTTDANARSAHNARISTKSGYDRKMQNKKKAAFERKREPNNQATEVVHLRTDADEWKGFE